MIETRRLIHAGAIAILAAGISGCVSGGPSSPAATSPVEGSWVDPNGLASSFNGGVFETRTTDTGQKLADGSYKVNGNSVEITVNSLVRKTTSNVTCLLVTPNQLNCTTSANQNFVLTRRGAAAA